MSFFSAFSGTCRGTEIFYSLQKVSIFKALLHLLLLVILCAVCVGCGEYFLNKKAWKRVETLFCEQFGSQLHNTAGVWQPSIAPKVGRSLQLPAQTLLLYVSTDEPERYSEELLAKQHSIILWAPGCLGTAAKVDSGRWLFMQYLPSGQINAIPEQLTTTALLKNLHAASSLPAGRWPEAGQSVESRSIFDMARFCFAAVLGAGYAFNSLMMVLMDTLCFALIFRIFSNRRQKFFTFAELWKIGIYAAFPVLAAVTAFPALQLPLLQHAQTFFMIGWMIYLLVILYTLRKNPEMSPENGEDHEKRE